MTSRRQLLVSAVGAASGSGAFGADDALPRSGLEVPELASFDEQMVAFMQRQRIVGGAAAVVREGRLLLARGYGLADREDRTPVQPTSLFRIASVSKPVTGLAVMAAIEDGLGSLSLGTPAFDYLGLPPFVKAGQAREPRLSRITVEHLLQHTGGWDRDRSGDLMFQHFQAAEDLGIASPPDHRSLIRWAMNRPLDFDPGSRYAYSNFGYCVLGRILEKAAGKGYEEFARSRVLGRLGIRRMRVGAVRRKEKLPDEVCYYDAESRTGRSIFSDDPEREVPLPYTLSPVLMDAHGGWLASVVDLARLAAGLDFPRGPSILKPASLQQINAPPPAPVSRTPEGKVTEVYYGLGWNVRTVATGLNRWHTGSMAGTSSILVRLANGNAWAAVFNTRGAGDELDRILHTAASSVSSWPKHDLFSRFG